MGNRILIIDDEKVMLEDLQKRLLSDGYKVYVEDTARGGLSRIKSFNPDIILLDILLPDMDGSEVAQLLQNDPQLNAIPIVFLSGIVSSETGGKECEVKVGGWTYRALGKPFTYKELLKEVEFVLGPKELQDSDNRQ